MYKNVRTAMEPCGAELYRATSGEEFTQLDQACFADSGTSLEGQGLVAQGKQAVHAQTSMDPELEAWRVRVCLSFPRGRCFCCCGRACEALGFRILDGCQARKKVAEEARKKTARDLERRLPRARKIVNV